jgi:hypothetical protein
MEMSDSEWEEKVAEVTMRTFCEMLGHLYGGYFPRSASDEEKQKLLALEESLVPADGIRDGSEFFRFCGVDVCDGRPCEAGSAAQRLFNAIHPESIGDAKAADQFWRLVMGSNWSEYMSNDRLIAEFAKSAVKELRSGSAE